MAFTFLVTGLIPLWVIQSPKYSSSVWQNELLLALIFRPASDNLVRACSSWSKCSSMLPLLIRSRLPRLACANTKPTMCSLIFSWKMLGLLHSPMGSLKYSHLPHGSTTVHSLE